MICIDFVHPVAGAGPLEYCALIPDAPVMDDPAGPGPAVRTCVTGISFMWEGKERTVPLSNVRMITYGVES